MTRPPLRRWLASRRETDVGRYLIVREAFLSLQESSERLVREGDDWAPSLRVRSRELLRILLGSKGGKEPPVNMMVTVSQRHMAALAADGELASGTRRRLQKAVELKERNCSFPLRDEGELLEGVAVAMMLHARLAGSR